MTITPLELLLLKNALQQIDALKFDSKTVYTLSRNMNWVESEVRNIESVRKKLAAELDNPEQNDPNFKEFLSKWEEFLASTIEIKDLRKINYEALNIGRENNQNSISIQTVNSLLPILED